MQKNDSFSNVYGGNHKSDGTDNVNNVVIVPNVKTERNADGQREDTFSIPGYKIEGGNSNGSYMTATTTNVVYDFSGLTKGQMRNFKDKIATLVNSTLYGGTNNKIMAHEVGHNFGLEHSDTYLAGVDGTNTYFDPLGAMTNKDFSPSKTDLLNVIKSAFNMAGLGTQNIEFVGEKIIDILNPPGTPNAGEYPNKKKINVKGVEENDKKENIDNRIILSLS